MNCKWSFARLSIISSLGLFITTTSFSAEKDYVKATCQGQTEVVLQDLTRIDCLTDTHAIEFDFGPKWAESGFQAMHYAMFTGKRAGVVLIISPTEKRFEKRLRALIAHYGLPVDVWMIPR